jgi:glycosyltransferase involved in cell wall biosynthesis
MKILFICPGGQTYLNSPSENLAQYINEHYENINIDIFNMSFRPPPRSASGYDLVWGDMDGSNVPTTALSLAKNSNLPVYIHGEWVPPFRFEEGWSEHFQTPTDLSNKQYYLNIIKAMSQADLVSLALSTTAGGFDWIKEKTGIEFKNKFIRYPASKKYSLIDIPKTNSIATIARVNDPKKRVKDNAIAISKLPYEIEYKLIGGSMIQPGVKISNLGKFNNDSKVKIFSSSKLALQHWSGIPPAEAIQQQCPVISYDIPYMKELYGDALIWVEKDNVDKLSETIDYWLTHDKEREEFAAFSKNLFESNKIGVKLDSERAKLVINNIKTII